MKTLIIIAALTLSILFASAQTKPVTLLKVVKEYPIYSQVGSYMIPSDIQVKTGDSLKKAGYIATGVRGSGHGTILVTYFKAIKK